MCGQLRIIAVLKTSEVRVAEGEAVERGKPMFVLRSDPVGDRYAQLRTAEAQHHGAQQALAIA